VKGELETRAPFLAHNRRMVAEIERLEHKSRRPDILVDEELIHAFLRRAPAARTSTRRARSSTGARRPRRASRSCSFLAREDLMRHEAAGITTDNFPPALQLGPNRFALDYHFEPRLAARRGDHDRAARASQPGAGGALRVAGAGDC
jgi:ATP-dependent helicase HrpA